MNRFRSQLGPQMVQDRPFQVPFESGRIQETPLPQPYLLVCQADFPFCLVLSLSGWSGVTPSRSSARPARPRLCGCGDGDPCIGVIERRRGANVIDASRVIVLLEERKLSKLQRRYSKAEFAILSECIKPYERWTVAERKSWARLGYGFRQFAAKNITPIEHYRPQPPMPPGGGARFTLSRR